VLERDTNRVVGNWPVLTDAEILLVLQGLAGSDSAGAKLAYVAGGEVRFIGEDGTLEGRADRAADPYLWPIAHDVRQRHARSAFADVPTATPPTPPSISDRSASRRRLPL